MLVCKAQQVAPVTRLLQHFPQAAKLIQFNEPLSESDFLWATYFHALALFEGAYELGCLEHSVRRSRIQPSVSASHALHFELAA